MNVFDSSPAQNPLGDAYKKWRGLLMQANLLCMLVVFFSEVLMFFVFKATGTLTYSAPVYLLRFLLLPSVFYALIALGGWFALRRLDERGRAINYVPIVQLTLLCCVICCFHHVFSATACSYCLPIFSTIIFNDKKMLRNIFLLSLVCLILAQLAGPVISSEKSKYFLAEFLVSFVFLLGSGIVCAVLARFLQDRSNAIQEIHRKQMETVEQLNLDQKTGLYGSTAFFNRLDQIVSSAEGKSRLGLAVLDIDDFKRINDTYGHVKGDEVLVSLAGIMKNLCGKRYLPVRFGGEEFALVFTNGTPQEYFDFTDTLREDFSRMKYSFTGERVTLSAGLAIWESGLSCEALFDRADKAMYLAKSSGKNRTCIYSE